MGVWQGAIAGTKRLAEAAARIAMVRIFRSDRVEEVGIYTPRAGSAVTADTLSTLQGMAVPVCQSGKDGRHMGCNDRAHRPHRGRQTNPYQHLQEYDIMRTVAPFNSVLDRMATLSRAMDEALNVQTANGQVWVPAVDAHETDQAYVVTIDLPGVRNETIDINFERNTLTVRGTRDREQTEEKDTRVFFREREWGAFERSLRFPHYVDGEKITANFSNGVLTVTVPKSDSARPRKISIA